MQDEVNQEESEQNEVDGMKKEADSTGFVNGDRIRFPLQQGNVQFFTR